MKKQNLTSIITFTLLIFFTTHIKSVKAGLLIEPYLGSFLNGVVEGDSATALNDLDDGEYDSTFKMTGTYLGARLGLSYFGLSFGADYLTSSNLTIAGSDSGSLTETGVFVGYALPFLLRFNFTYILNSKMSSMTDDSDGDIEIEYGKGVGTKFGLGINLLPLVTLNLELKTVKYTSFNYEVDGDAIWDIPAYQLLGVDDDWEDHNNTVNSFMISVSVPLTI